MNNRMAFTVVTTENEDDAFDMFEALNTTGEPLTAYETFKPKVIEAEKLDIFEHSDSKKHMDKIEAYLDRFNKAEQKQRATSEMLVPFALCENGHKLSKRLNDQRRYLRDQYNDLGNIEKQRAFVERLSHVAYFLNFLWDIEPNKNLTFEPLNIDDDVSTLSCLALRSIKHHITIAPLSRFYGEALKKINAPDKDKKTDEFKDALKATLAFSMLWRGAFGGTNNIESIYRDLMRVGVEEIHVNPLSESPEKGTGSISLPNYKKALKHILANQGKITSREDWVKKASQVAIYSTNKEVARFLLVCACHDSINDVAAPGLIKQGTNGILDMMNQKIWKDENYFTVEHIAPQSNKGDWDKALYEDAGFIHRLGNLILVPDEVNLILSNKNWAHKKQMYLLLASKDRESFDKHSKACVNLGIKLTKKAEEVLSNSKFLPMCESIGNVDAEWTTQFVVARSERIAGLAYDRLSKLLE